MSLKSFNRGDHMENPNSETQTIKNRLDDVKQEIYQAAKACKRDPETIKLVAVSKKKSVVSILEAIDAAVEILGENYIQEAVEKIETIGRTPASWHFIGHLQSNKAKFAVRYFDLIHTVDKLKLAKEINRQAKKIGKIQSILMQINISKETSKSGTDEEDAVKLAHEISKLENVSLKGLMGMPPFFGEPERARPFFKALHDIKTQIERQNIPGITMEHLSMGMSGDFKVAIEEGSTLVRIGTAIFGSRN